MPKRLTEQQVIIKSNNTIIDDYHGIYVEGYINNSTPCVFQCPICGEYFKRKPNSVWNNKSILIFCKKCGLQRRNAKITKSSQEVEIIYQKLGFKLLESYTRSKDKLKTLCHCGKEFYVIPASILSNQTKSCGHCNDPKIGDKIHNLTIIDIKTSNSYGCRIRAQCDCGNITKWLSLCWLKNGSNKTCGKCNFPNIGDKFNRLTIIEIKPDTSGCSVRCCCECGNITDWINHYKLINGHNKSCGNCSLMRNGRFTSSTALQLHNIIEKILGKSCKHNHHIKGIGCVDIAQPELKIVVEYDGYYNHKIRNGDRTSKDQAKYRKLINSGWKLLNIKSDGTDIPSEQQLKKVLLNHFQHNTRQYTITMDSWHKAQKKYG